MEKPAVTFAATVLLVLPLFNRKVTINYNAIKKKHIYPEQECSASFHQVRKPEEIQNTSDLVI